MLRHNFHQPLFATALFKSYVQTNSAGEPISRWRTDPAGMLAKCAEALALRRAFPNEMSGLYTTEEMDQADNPSSVVPITGKNGTAALAVEKSQATGQRPFTPEELRANFARAVAAIEAKGLTLGPDDHAITESTLGSIFEDERHLESYLEFTTGIPYLEDMSEAQVVALLRLLKPVLSDGDFLPCDEAQAEATAVIHWLDSTQRTGSKKKTNEIEMLLCDG